MTLREAIPDDREGKREAIRKLLEALSDSEDDDDDEEEDEDGEQQRELPKALPQETMARYLRARTSTSESSENTAGQRGSAFKAWATQQLNKSLGHTPSYDHSSLQLPTYPSKDDKASAEKLIDPAPTQPPLSPSFIKKSICSSCQAY